MTKFIAICLAFGALGMGCQHQVKTATTKEKVDGSNTGGLIETYDMNKDGRIDSWIYFDKEKPADTGDENEPKPDNRRVVKRRSDLNFDGKVDVTQNFKDGVLTLEEIDLDLDATPDIKTYYENGKPAKSELDLGFDGMVDVWRFYKEGNLERKEIDTNADGKPDEWEYFESDRLVRVGKDLNKDGVVDIWE